MQPSLLTILFLHAIDFLTAWTWHSKQQVHPLRHVFLGFSFEVVTQLVHPIPGPPVPSETTTVAVTESCTASAPVALSGPPSLVSQGDHRIDAHGAARRDITRGERNENQQASDGHKR